MKTRPGARAGFTLAEVAVTLVIVSIGLVLVLQGLTTAKISAAETHHRKIARGLAQLTLGQLESGLFWEEVDDSRDVLTGTYADEGYEDFSYELLLGDQEFSDTGRYDEGAYHDSWKSERERQDRLKNRDKDEDDEERVEQPFEKVRIKVTYPKLADRPNEFVLERWIPWEQVYGTKDKASGSSSSSGSGAKPEEPAE